MGRLETQLGYGLGVPGAQGIVTPYAGLSLAEGGNRPYKAGALWNVAPEAVLGLKATRHETAAGDPATAAITLRT